MIARAQTGFPEEPITMYVGKIPKTIPDEVIRKFLEVGVKQGSEVFSLEGNTRCLGLPCFLCFFYIFLTGL